MGDAKQPRPGILGNLVDPSPSDEEDLVDEVVHEAGLHSPADVPGHRRVLRSEQSLKASGSDITIHWFPHVPLIAG
jgi:hypothetical protein